MTFQTAKQLLAAYQKKKDLLIAKYHPIYEEMINIPLKAEIKVLREKLEKDLKDMEAEEAMEV